MCELHIKDKTHSQIKEVVQMKCREQKHSGGDDIFRTRPDRPWGLPSLLYNGYRVSFGGGG
jgi:hypothetical protein